MGSNEAKSVGLSVTYQWRESCRSSIRISWDGRESGNTITIVARRKPRGKWSRRDPSWNLSAAFTRSAFLSTTMATRCFGYSAILGREKNVFFAAWTTRISMSSARPFRLIVRCSADMSGHPPRDPPLSRYISGGMGVSGKRSPYGKTNASLASNFRTVSGCSEAPGRQRVFSTRLIDRFGKDGRGRILSQIFGSLSHRITTFRRKVYYIYLSLIRESFFVSTLLLSLPTGRTGRGIRRRIFRCRECRNCGDV